MGEASGNIHADFDVEDVLSQLDLEEKISLLSGSDFWHTVEIPRLNVPAIRFTDGPNGVRGTKFFNGVPAACLPCGTAIASTFDRELIQAGGALQGRESIARGASIILGPTTNMQRTPLGGRGFESFSEDPVLAGAVSAATVKGIQSTGVGACIKHFVGNDQEDQRMSCDSIISERALREIYLKPFQIANLESNPAVYMTGYNSLNGQHCSENKPLIQGLLRGEWAYQGAVVSDWFGTYSTTEAIKAGLDLEMPGPAEFRGKMVQRAMQCGKLGEYDLDERVRKVLELVHRCLPLQIPSHAPEAESDSPETAALLRKLAADGIVLLKNDTAVLPFQKAKSIAVIGPNAAIAAYCGGGSSALPAYYAISPLAGMQSAAKGSVYYSLGVPGWKNLPLLSYASQAENGKPGLTMRVFLQPPGTPDRKSIDTIYMRESMAILADYKHPDLPMSALPLYYATLTGTLSVSESRMYNLSLVCAGTSKMYINDKLVVDNETEQRVGEFCFGTGTAEEKGAIHLEAGQTHQVRIEFATLPTQKVRKSGSTAFGAGGIRIGFAPLLDVDEERTRAVELARKCDQVLICAGLNAEWESEGFDRTDMLHPAGIDQLVDELLDANPNTAVVLQSGTPIELPWLHKAKAVLWAGYGGNETGNAIADVVYGDTAPSGKLSLTWPKRVEDSPTWINGASERNRIFYGEGIYIGYRWYERRKIEVAFPFGHGLSYSSFSLSDLTVTAEEAEDVLKIECKIKNTGSVVSNEVVQMYISQESPGIGRPVKELKGFTKVKDLEPGREQTAEISCRLRDAVSWWDEERKAWIVEKGRYTVLIGRSSAHMELDATFEISKTFWWNGL